MKRGMWAVWMACALLLGSGSSAMAESQAAKSEDKPLVIHFDKGQNTLGPADRSAIRRMLAHRKPGPGKKILVVGYSDSRRDSNKNMNLSRQRAEAVRNEIIQASGEVVQHVLVLARGAENPIGDNRNPQGRARNRRVEIYWTQAMDKMGKPIGARTVPSAAVTAMVQEARTLIRRRQLAEAVRILERARAQGADEDGNWLAVYGIAGFYAGMDVRTAKNYLGKALDLDPYNQEAREYLGRIQAREKVADGTVGARMGRSEQDPIPVTCDAQTHEYLRLFAVQPLSKQRSTVRPLETWHCRDGQGGQVVYYFDRSQVHAWVFDPGGSDPLGARGSMPISLTEVTVR